MIAFTICSKNFLAYAQSLHASLLASNGDVTFYVALCDDSAGLELNSFNFEILTIATIGIPRWDDMRNRYNITELNTSIKPFAFLYLFDRHRGEIVHYFDPDILAVSRFDELHALAADGVDCILTPHLTTPGEFADVNDRQYLIYGVHNLGFCALRATPEVERIVSWWARRLETECVIDLPRGLFVDQKWADLLPCYIERTKLLRNAGYNVAYWNLPQRRVVLQDGQWLVNGVPLRFFHFSGNQIENPSVFARHSPGLTLENIGDVRLLLAKYRDDVYRWGHAYFIGLSYAFTWEAAGRENEHTSASVAERRRQVSDPTPFLPLLPLRSVSEYTAVRSGLTAILDARLKIDASAVAAPGATITLRGYCVVCGRISRFQSMAPSAAGLASQLSCTACGLTNLERASLQILQQCVAPAQGDRILVRAHREQFCGRLGAKFPGVAVVTETDDVDAEDPGFDIVVTAEPFDGMAAAEAVAHLRDCLRPGGFVLLAAALGAADNADLSPVWTVVATFKDAGFLDVAAIPYWSRELCYLGEPQIVVTARKTTAGAARKPRVALVGHDANPYGAQMLLLNIARRIARHGAVEARVLLGGPGTMEEMYRRVAPTEVIDGWFADQQLWHDAAARLARRGIAAVLCNTLAAARALPTLRTAGLRVVTLVHELPALIREYDLVEVARMAARDSDVMVFASHYVHDRFVEIAGPVRHRRVIRPQGLYLTPLPWTERLALRMKARAELGAAEHDLIVLSAGVGTARKGIDLWPEVIRRVRASYPGALFVWAGAVEPEMITTLSSDIHAAAGETHARLVGQIADMTPYYAAADVFVLPSREDPYPSVVLEAMAYGIPVVAFEGAGGLSDLLRDTGNTPLPLLDTAAMAARIVTLLRDPKLRGGLRDAGQQRIARDYDFGDYVADLCNLLSGASRTVSVIVPNYNYAHYLHARIASIRGQTYPIYELILLDDASTDDSAAVIAEIERDWEGRVRVLRNTENSGAVVHQWMRGVELAQGELVWIAEADDLSDPGFLAATTRAFDDSEVVLSYSQSRQIDDVGKVLREDYADYLDDVDPGRWRHDYVRPGPTEIAEVQSVRNTIPNVSAVVFRRSALGRVLIEHREELVTLRNTADWCCYLHLLRHGSVAFTARPLNSHRRHARGVTLSTNDRRHLDEIGVMQRLAAELVTVSPDRAIAARDWRRAVARLFGLVEESV